MGGWERVVKDVKTEFDHMGKNIFSLEANRDIGYLGAYLILE